LDERLEAALEARVGRHLHGLEADVTLLHARAQCLGDECQASTSHAEAAWREESYSLRRELRALHQELTTSTKKWHASAKKNARSLEALSVGCEKVAVDLARLQQQGVSHEWRIPKCMQRLQYLSMDADAGVWLDSPEFTLGCLSSLVLRLYPRGISGGDGQCAVGLYAAAVSDGRHALPVHLDLRLAGMSRSAVASCEENASFLWLATGFGRLPDLVGESEDLVIGVEIPPLAWASSLACAAPSSTLPPGCTLAVPPRSVEPLAGPGAALEWAPDLCMRSPAAAMVQCFSQSGTAPRAGAAGSAGRHGSPRSDLSGARSKAPACGGGPPPPLASPSRPGWALFADEVAMNPRVPERRAASKNPFDV